MESTAKLLDFSAKDRRKKFIYKKGGIYQQSSESLKENAPIYSGGEGSRTKSVDEYFKLLHIF